nr:hypothetical protein [Tanacetum cinerariifolium]
MVYTSRIKQFWTSAKVKTINDDVWIHALVDERKVVVNEASIRRYLRLDDVKGTACLPNDAIFKELARVGKHKSRRKQRKETKVPQEETPTKEHIPTPSHDPLPSEEGLGDLEDASKQGRIAEIDADEDLSLINATAHEHGRMNEKDLFGVNDLDGNEVIVDVTAGKNVEQDATVAEKEVSAAADEVVTTAESVEAIDSEVMEGSKKTQAEVTEDSSKRARDEIEQESAKRQRLEKEDDTAELKRCLKIVPEDDDDKQHPYLLNLLP